MVKRSPGPSPGTTVEGSAALHLVKSAPHTSVFPRCEGVAEALGDDRAPSADGFRSLFPSGLQAGIFPGVGREEQRGVLVAAGGIQLPGRVDRSQVVGVRPSESQHHMGLSVREPRGGLEPRSHGSDRSLRRPSCDRGQPGTRASVDSPRASRRSIAVTRNPRWHKGPRSPSGYPLRPRVTKRCGEAPRRSRPLIHRVAEDPGWGRDPSPREVRASSHRWDAR
jgi:hypothetical protein